MQANLDFLSMQGASHQIFHVLIDFGQVVFLLGLRKVMLRRYQHAGGPMALQSSKETSLSLWIEPSIPLRSGIQLSFETSLSVLMDSGIALWEGTQV